MMREVPGSAEIQARDKTDTLLNSLGALAEPLQALTHHNPLSSYGCRSCASMEQDVGSDPKAGSAMLGDP